MEYTGFRQDSYLGILKIKKKILIFSVFVSCFYRKGPALSSVATVDILCILEQKNRCEVMCVVVV